MALLLYNFFHLNLAYSAIEEADRARVIERCYWPLLRLAQRRIARRAAGDRHPQPLTAAGRRVTKKPRGGRTRRDSAPTREKRHFWGKTPSQGAAFRAGAASGRGSNTLTSRSAVGQRLRKCH